MARPTRARPETDAERSTFRGSDDTLDREIATLEGHARLRVRRVAAELGELERELRELRRERARRRRASAVAVAADATGVEAALTGSLPSD